MLGAGAEQFANRLRKNQRRLGKQLRRDGITCYRLYDADLPDYNLVVDVYGDWVHVQEYAPPAEIDLAKVRRRLEDALGVIGAVLDVPPEHVVLKERRRQRGAAQYERRATRGEFLRVEEDDLTYLVNLHDYLDTGLFVDQRLTRRLVRTLAGGRRFLNLFAYTGTMTVDALAGGSPASTTVDLSATYLEWARRNLEANGFTASRSCRGHGGRGALRRRAGRRVTVAGTPVGGTAPHRLIRADCLQLAGRGGGRVRPRLARPADVLQLQAHGPRHLRRAARPRRPDPHDRATPPGAGRHHSCSPPTGAASSSTTGELAGLDRQGPLARRRCRSTAPARHRATTSSASSAADTGATRTPPRTQPRRMQPPTAAEARSVARQAAGILVDR